MILLLVVPAQLGRRDGGEQVAFQNAPSGQDRPGGSLTLFSSAIRSRAVHGSRSSCARRRANERLAPARGCFEWNDTCSWSVVPKPPSALNDRPADDRGGAIRPSQKGRKKVERCESGVDPHEFREKSSPPRVRLAPMAHENARADPATRVKPQSKSARPLHEGAPWRIALS